jgi:phage FluMu protein Com
MSKIEAVCPHCKGPNAVEKNSHADIYGLQHIRCSHCSKSWSENLSEPDVLAKSAPASSELAELRVQLNAQFAELLSKLQGLTERQAAAPQSVSFQPQRQETATVVKFVAGLPGGAMLESDIADAVEATRQQSTFVTKAADRDAVAHAELDKALANGKPGTSPSYTRLDDGLEKDAPAKFRPIESVFQTVESVRAPNVERAAPAERRPFQPR